jgi:hypothetical protein
MDKEVSEEADWVGIEKEVENGSGEMEGREEGLHQEKGNWGWRTREELEGQRTEPQRKG